MKQKFTIIICIFIFQIAFITFSQAFDPINPINLNINQSSAIIADHRIMNKVRNNEIPDSAIFNAKNNLRIAYGHTSHGSQITSGMQGLVDFKNGQSQTYDLYSWNWGGTSGALDLRDGFAEGDLGNPDRITWANRTREYLEDVDNSEINVIMWSWCGQASTSNPADIQLYLDLMVELEEEFPLVVFIYMTGHSTGAGLEGDLHQRNNQIRNHCKQNNKVLFDFEDIECYDPDGKYYGDKYVTDGCNYDFTGDGDKNWAQDWQISHTEDVHWYNCSSAHSEPLNANMKAYAAWWLWAVLAGWDDPNSSIPSSSSITNSSQNGSNTSVSTSFPTIWISLVGLSIIFFKKRRR